MAKSTFVQLIIGAKDEASKVLGSVASGLTKVSAAAAATATAVASYFGVKLFTGGIESAANFESAMARIKAATGANAEEMAALSKAAEDAGRNTVFSSGEAANALEILGKAGLGAKDSIAALPSLLALAEGQSLDLNTAAGLLTDTVNQMGLSFADAATVADVLAKGANLSNTSVQDLGSALSYAGAGAKNAGLNLQQTVAVLDALAQSGLRGERAGTALQQILVQLSNPASQARVELAKLGATSSNFGDALEAIKNAGDAATPAINAFGQSAIPAIRALSSGGVDAVNAFATQLNNAGGAAQSASSTIADTLTGALRSLGSSWDALSQYLTKPLLQPIADSARDLTAAINDSVASGNLDKLRDSIVTTFKAGVKAVQEFVASFDFDEATTKASDAIGGLSEKFATISGIGTKTADGLTASWYLFKAGVDSLGGALSELLGAFVALGLGAVKVLAKVGLASQDTVIAMENIKQSIGDAAQAYDDDLVKSLEKSGAAFNRLTGTAEAASTAVGKSAPKADEATAAFNRQAEAMKKLGMVFDETTQSFVASSTGTTSALDQTKAALERQLVAVKAQAQAGILSAQTADGYTQSLEKQISALGKTAGETSKLGKSANDAATQTDQLYQSLGLVNKAAEESKLDQQKSQLDALYASGAITTAEYYKLAEAIQHLRDLLNGGGGDGGGEQQQIDKNGQLGKSAKDAAEKQQQQADATAAAAKAALDAAPAVSAYQEAISSQLTGIATYNAELEKNINLTIQQGQSWYGVATAIRDLKSTADTSPLGKLNQELEAASASSQQAAKDMQTLGTAAQITSYQGFGAVLSAIASQKKAVADGAAENLRYQISLEKIGESASKGSLGLEQQLAALTALKSQYRNLDQSSLSALQSQIDQVSASLKSMSDAADQTLSSLQSQLAQAQGRLADQAAIDAQQKILELQAKINEAKKAGNSAALADLQQALEVQKQINDINIKNAKTQQDQAKANPATTTNTPPTQATTQTVKTVRIDLGNGGGFDVPATQEDQVMAFINQLKIGKGVATR